LNHYRIVCNASLGNLSRNNRRFTMYCCLGWYSCIFSFDQSWTKHRSMPIYSWNSISSRIETGIHVAGFNCMRFSAYAAGRERERSIRHPPFGAAKGSYSCATYIQPIPKTKSYW